jgi:glycosidase
LSNHNQPRSVSRYGDASTELHREKSAKMLAIYNHMMQGTSYGMTNFPFAKLEEVNDIESLNAYRQLVETQKVLSHEQMMGGIRKNGRDNMLEDKYRMKMEDTANMLERHEIGFNLSTRGSAVEDQWLVLRECAAL